ncbi:hypothetical protein NAMH_0027 [Nautilia profundicola AmH]|uniref:Uncharacterized protein n=1 Tax=Nautilia profundicola (strain ATCC BAA-1463 / DSM 18972 / AmH) TaxID=598659 RepID=B9L761_NAUPA|nr:hypothetical protein [Nautilia profundicola]ACM92952.1 hypothetical protein NAMH_0027 [Nautilia profundicola AmH]
MFSESDFEKLKKEALKEAEKISEQKIKEAKEKLQYQKDVFFNSLNINREKELLNLKYEKILKEKETSLYKKYEKELEKIYKNIKEKTTNELLTVIHKNGESLCKCFLNKLQNYQKGTLFLPKYLKNKCQSNFTTVYTDNECFIFKTGNKHIVFDPIESINKILQGELCLK